jgi:hypothetical protein
MGFAFESGKGAVVIEVAITEMWDDGHVRGRDGMQHGRE